MDAFEEIVLVYSEKIMGKRTIGSWLNYKSSYNAEESGSWQTFDGASTRT